jgi:hypothetical protein
MFTSVHESRRRREQRRPYVPRHERDGFRADRNAGLAVALAVLLVFVAAASAHAAVLRVAARGPHVATRHVGAASVPVASRHATAVSVPVATRHVVAAPAGLLAAGLYGVAGLR